MTLFPKERNDIIAYRISRAWQTFQEAKDNAALQHWNLAVNRLYYAVFYMALAVNVSNGDSARTHNGVFSIISKKYIATGLLDKENGSLYRRLFSMRQSGDYDDLFDWDENDVAPLVEKTEQLIISMHKLVRDYDGL